MTNSDLFPVTLISANTYFAFTPLLASCAVGTLEYRTALESVRAFAPEAHTYLAWCDNINFQKKELTCTPSTSLSLHENKQGGKEPSSLSDDRGNAIVGPKFVLNYDRLVIAVGAYAQTFGIPGVKENAQFLKDVRDARAIRTRILELFGEANLPIMSDAERRKLLHFCVVGGGPTGVEFAAELHDLLATDLTRAFPHLTPMARITLYDVAPQILGSFDQELVKYATDRFRRNGITIKAEHHVERVNKGSMIVKEDGEVPFGLLVWSTGLAANPLINSIKELTKDGKTGSLLVNDRLNVIRDDGQVMEDIWAIGDAAVCEKERLPATAQVAYQEAKYVAKQLNAIAKGGQPSNAAFEFKNLGTLAYLGDW
ncbi:hypothetical protein Clacol_008960 [Clathrus columnatus]|uniref:FAD/NAD(P)-binding domain-containing protein n=1 Tax=Clathrus columnatus TaxID=1419009 RepID=A0AAV5ANQ5_9AGAM|nr:hypothetical protein Clacol_008960 [Clathrus columnatus]